MAKVKVNLNVGQLTARAKTEVGRFLKQAEIEKEIQTELVRTIRDERKLPSGKTVPPLKKKTIDRRRALAKTNPTNETFTPARSNLTFTGELLDKGLKSKFLIRGLKIIIDAKKGSHKKYKGVKGKRIGKTRAKYADIFEGQAAQGRDVFDISNKFLDNVTKIIRNKLKKFLS